MSDSKRETVDHWSFVEGVKNPLGRLADKENGERKPTIFRGGIASRLDKAQRLMV